MNNRFLTIGLLSALAVSCTVSEVPGPVDTDDASQSNIVYYATIDDEPDDATRTLADDQYHVLWHADDRITMFEDLPYGQEYRFAGEDNDPAGPFEPIPFEGYIGGGSDLGGKTFALYPHRKDTKINTDGVITYQFPGIQTYLPNSFGRGSNPMMAQAEGKVLRFKNVGGYLCFKLYGDNVSVSSLTLEGNGGEALTGEGQIVMTDGTPVVTMNREKSSNKVILYCNDPVELGADADHYTLFWFVLPPVAFSKDGGGFTLTVSTSDGKVFSKSAAMDLEIERNNIKNMAPLNVVPTGSVSGLSLDGIKPHAANVNYKTTYDASTRTFTVTMPTVTDFSSLVFDYEVDGDALLVDGGVIENGVTPVDASQPVSLTVRSGNKDVRYTLLARNTGLPVVRITTNGYTQADIENDPDHEAWFSGATIRIEKADGTVDLETASMEIKGRGNATWKYNKRPFALKLEKKAKVLGMKKHKRWILLANWKDRTLLRNDAAFWLSKQSGLRYTVSGYFVELEFNGVHRGNYYLCEQIKINENRLGLTEIQDAEVGTSDPYLITGPYLMEIDNNFDEQYKFESGFYNSGLKYMFADPDSDLSSEAQAYMENYIKEMERLIKKIRDRRNPDYDGYKEYLDMDSAIWFMFINELTGNGDFFNTDGGTGSTYYGPHSTFLYKDRDVMNEDGTTTVSKLFMGPVWDFDYKTFISTLKTGYTQENRSKKWVGANNQNYYYYYLCKDPEFKQRMLELWETYYGKVTEDAFNRYIDGMAGSLLLSEEFNTEMWGYSNTAQDQAQNGDNQLSFLEAVDLLKKAFKEKRAFMNSNLANLNQ